MTDVYKLWPARAAFVDPQTGLLTSEAVKALGRIAELLGGNNNTLPVTFVYVPASGAPHGVVFLNSLGELTSTPAPTNGQVLIGSTGSDPVLASITGTVNRVTVNNGAGTVTLSTPQDIHTAASPTFADATLTALTARSFLYSGAGSLITSTLAPTNGQLLVGSTGSDPVAASMTGTANQVVVTNGPGSITFSLPQSIHTAATPTFASLTLSGLTANSFAYSGASGLLTSAGAPTNGQLLIGSTGAAPVRAAITGTANQVTVTNSAGGITLSLPQDIHTGATPDFVGLVGTITNDNAAAGVIGEYIESSVSSGSPVSLVTSTAKTVTSIALTAGDWDVSGWVGFSPAGTTTATAYAGEITTTNNTLDSEYGLLLVSTTAGNAAQKMAVASKRISLAGSATIYLIASATFAVSTMGAYGRISARRAR